MFLVGTYPKGNRSQVQGSTFRVKDKEGIEDLKSSLEMLIFPSNYQFVHFSKSSKSSSHFFRNEGRVCGVRLENSTVFRCQVSETRFRVSGVRRSPQTYMCNAVRRREWNLWIPILSGTLWTSERLLDMLQAKYYPFSHNMWAQEGGHETKFDPFSRRRRSL